MFAFLNQKHAATKEPHNAPQRRTAQFLWQNEQPPLPHTPPHRGATPLKTGAGRGSSRQGKHDYNSCIMNLVFLCSEAPPRTTECFARKKSICRVLWSGGNLVRSPQTNRLIPASAGADPPCAQERVTFAKLQDTCKKRKG